MAFFSRMQGNGLVFLHNGFTFFFELDTSLFFLIFIDLFSFIIFLAASGLNCGMWDLP